MTARRWYAVPLTIYVRALDPDNARGMTGIMTRDSAGGRLHFRFGEAKAIHDPTCPICEGSKIDVDDPLKACQDCGGDGVVLP